MSSYFTPVSDSTDNWKCPIKEGKDLAAVHLHLNKNQVELKNKRKGKGISARLE